MGAFKWNPLAFVGSFSGNYRGNEFAVPFGDGYMDGSFIDGQYAEDAVTVHNGIGVTTLVLNANFQATLAVTLVQGADQNTILSQLVPTARNNLNYMPTGVLQLRDMNSGTMVKSPLAVIQKMSQLTRGKDVQAQVWNFILTDAEFKIFGAADF